MYDSIIIGAGSSGLYCAQKLASASFKVLIIEQKKEIGKNIICTGIVSKRAFDEFKLNPGSILMPIKQMQIISPCGSYLIYEHPDILSYVVDRELFNKNLAKEAQAKGAELLLNASVEEIKTAHVEAGLRTNNKYNPFSEEMNRRLTDCLSDIFFVPTERAKMNLLKEGVPAEAIHITGNTVVDALLITLEKLKNRKTQQYYERFFREKYGILFDSAKIILVTAHRRESFGNDFEEICRGLKKIALNSPDVRIINPVHLNPNVQKPVRNLLQKIKNMHLIEPLDYCALVWLMSKSYLILTDSGGIQEEAPSLKIPVLVMRKTTERPEGIESGVAKLVGIDSENIYNKTMELLNDSETYRSMASGINSYGDGKASERIVKACLRYLKIYCLLNPEYSGLLRRFTPRNDYKGMFAKTFFY